MNMKLKAVNAVLAASLLGLAGGSSAAVLNTGTTLGVSGDVVLVAVDNSPGTNFEKTFVADLELTYADLVNGVAVDRTWNLLNDPKYSAAFAAYQNRSLSFFVTRGYALDNANLSNFDKSGTVAAFSDPINTQWGGVVSAKSSAVLNPTYTPVGNFSGSSVGQVVQGAVSDNINATGQNGKSATVDPSASLGSLFSQYQFFAASSGLATSFSDVILAGAIGGGGAGNLLWVTTTDPGDHTGAITNLGSLSLDSGTGVLSFIKTTSPAPIPVPAAAWLFGSALAGLLGFGRRGKQT